jgi:hypothetical protein
VKELLSAERDRRGDLGRCCAAAAAVGLSSLLSPRPRFGDAESLRATAGSGNALVMRSRTSWLARRGYAAGMPGRAALPLALHAQCTT